MKYSLEKIKAMAPAQRAQLYANAKTTDSDEARQIVALIEEAGLPFSEDGALAMDHPLTRAIRDVVHSSEGRKACVRAADAGLPAIAGVDPMLAAKFPADYGKHNQATHWAGKFVAEVMSELGYRQIGRMGDTPQGCIARSGELYERR